MTIWITGDTHFGHTKIQRSVENFEDLILTNLKKQIRKHDTLVHLGDFALKHHKVWLDAFHEATEKCDTIYLVRGNHDRKGISFYRSAFDSVTDGFFLRYAGQRIHFSHMPCGIHDSSGFRPIADVNIHGHLHHHLSFYPPEFIKYAPEDHSYMPVSLDYLLKGRVKNKCYACRGTGCFACGHTGETSYVAKNAV